MPRAFRPCEIETFGAGVVGDTQMTDVFLGRVDVDFFNGGCLFQGCKGKASLNRVDDCRCERRPHFGVSKRLLGNYRLPKKLKKLTLTSLVIRESAMLNPTEETEVLQDT